MSGKDGTPRGEAGQKAPDKSQGMGQGMSMEADRDMRTMDGMKPMMRSMISQMMASSGMGPMAGLAEMLTQHTEGALVVLKAELLISDSQERV